MGVISRPEPLAPRHDLQHFDCGQPSLNAWLKDKARRAQQFGGSARTYVVCDEHNRVIGYYALAAGSINRSDAAGKVRRNMPDSVPIVLLGRLAVDLSSKGRGIGSGLLKDALLRVLGAAEEIGIRAILVHALDENARRFYLERGFYDSPTNPFTLMITVREIESALNRR